MLKVDEKLAETRMLKKKLNNFAKNNRKLKDKPKEKTEREGKVAYFCLHASRLYLQLVVFMQDSLHVTKGTVSSKKLCVGSQFPEEPERD